LESWVWSSQPIWLELETTVPSIFLSRSSTSHCISIIEISFEFFNIQYQFSTPSFHRCNWKILEFQFTSWSLAHNIAVTNQNFIFATHLNFQQIYTSSANQHGIVPLATGTYLNGTNSNTIALLAYYSTNLSVWGLSLQHFCCLNHNLGCFPARWVSRGTYNLNINISCN
jgi:hypothetical protein